jgi:16S rRNA (guanine527-N7)-methyltransferase
VAQSAAVRLNELLAAAGFPRLETHLAGQFQAYFDLLLHWNARLNLTAVRDQEGILCRHFVESIACARTVPAGVTSLLDFGSGAGFPGIPIALCRPEIRVTLAESQAKKAAFLREAVRTLGLQTEVFRGRAETLRMAFDCVAMRAVDRMEKSVGEGARLVAPGGYLVLMTSVDQSATLRSAAGDGLNWCKSEPLPFSAERQIEVGRRNSGTD